MEIEWRILVIVGGYSPLARIADVESLREEGENDKSRKYTLFNREMLSLRM